MSSQRVLYLTNIYKFSIQLHIYMSLNVLFVPYHIYSKIDKWVDTLGKFSTYQKTIGVFN